jgi:hypothetical protein
MQKAVFGAMEKPLVLDPAVSSCSMRTSPGVALLETQRGLTRAAPRRAMSGNSNMSTKGERLEVRLMENPGRHKRGSPRVMSRGLRVAVTS